MKLDKISKADWRFVPKDPDASFDPKHNEFVVEKTIRDYEAIRKQKHQEAVEKVQERSQALATYFKSLIAGGATSNVVKYFGKKELLRLRGNEIRERLDQLRVMSPDGKLLRKPQ